MRAANSETGIRMYGLDLLLTKCKDGYSYDWQDGSGQVWCCGWSRGTKEDAKEEAVSHLKEKA